MRKDFNAEEQDLINRTAEAILAEFPRLRELEARLYATMALTGTPIRELREALAQDEGTIATLAEFKSPGCDEALVRFLKAEKRKRRIIFAIIWLVVGAVFLFNLMFGIGI